MGLKNNRSVRRIDLFRRAEPGGWLSLNGRSKGVFFCSPPRSPRELERFKKVAESIGAKALTYRKDGSVVSVPIRRARPTPK